LANIDGLFCLFAHDYVMMRDRKALSICFGHPHFVALRAGRYTVGLLAQLLAKHKDAFF